MDELEGKTLDEIRAIADKLNIKYHHRALADTIAAQIRQQGVAAVDDAMKHPAQKDVVKPVKFNTQEEILEAIDVFVKKGVQITFDEDEKTCTMRYKGREECVNMSVPLRILKTKAENVARGALSPKGFKDGQDVVLWA